MRSERLLSLLLLLQARNPRNAGELARLLEVTPRTIFRDVDALAAAGIPIYSERGSAGGIALTEGYHRSLTHFSGEELHVLFVASSQPLTDLGVAAADGALLKLAGTLSDVQRRDARKARERVLLDQQKWYRSAQPAPILAALRAATWDDMRVRLTYRDRSGTATTREIEPLGLVSKAGVWYVVARRPDGETRSFRAERIIDARVLDERFERPADFDLETYWYASTAALERPVMHFEAMVRLRGEGTSLFGYWDAEVIENDRAERTYRLRFPGEEAALFQIMAWGPRVEVLEPASLREAVLRCAHEIAEIYLMEPVTAGMR